MSAHAAAAGSGCCCKPPDVPCSCGEMWAASTGPEFDRLAVSCSLNATYEGKDCCGAQLFGGASFSGGRLRRRLPLGFPGYESIPVTPCFEAPGEIAGSIGSTIGQCARVVECCNYVGCPPVRRNHIISRTPWFWCPDTYSITTSDVCAGVVCQCDEGGVPCGGQCPAFFFQDTESAQSVTDYLGVRVELLRFCDGDAFHAAVKIDIRRLGPDPESCVSCATSTNGTNLPIEFTCYYTKRCRFPGDTIKGVYGWNEVYSNGPSTQVLTIREHCLPDIIPGGELYATRTVIASPTLVVE